MVGLKFLLFEALCWFFSVFRFVFPRPVKNTAFVIPPDDSGSLGDEAMVLVLKRTLEAKGYSVVYFSVSGVPERQWGQYVYSKSKVLRLFELIRNVLISNVTVVVGADVIDGKYSDLYSYVRLRMAVLAEQVGNFGVVTPCSFNKSPSPLVCRLAKKYSKVLRIFSRDDSSFDNMVAAGLKPAKAADLAFGLHRLKFDKARGGSGFCFDGEIDTSAFGFDRDGVYVGLNINPLIPKVNRRFTSDAIHGALMSFLESKAVMSVSPIAHDIRPQSDDLQAANDFILGYAGPISKKIKGVAVPKKAPEVESAFEGVNLVVAGRMHLAIAALGAGLPVIAFSYQDKFAGLQKLVGENNLILLDGDVDLAPGHLDALAKDLLEHSLRGSKSYLKDIGLRIERFVSCLPEACNAN